MRVPFKPVYFEKTTRRFKYVIIHDLSCRFPSLAEAQMDSRKPTTSILRNYNWLYNDEYDLPYHFLCEKIGKDFETVIGTPFCYKCIFEDIPKQYDASIHIALAGNFDILQPSTRSYQQIGYRPIASVLRWFGIPLGKIFLHREVSTDKESSCPGEFFDKAKFMSLIKPMILMKG